MKLTDRQRGALHALAAFLLLAGLAIAWCAI
jgi:hypothetical protein